MNRQDIIEALKLFPYDRNEYWIITGSAMVMYGIRKETHDIDLGCTAAMADALEADGLPVKRTADGKRHFRYGDDIELFEEWLCDTTQTIEGLRVITPKGLTEMKKALGREKDLRDIAMIEAFMSGFTALERNG